MNVMLFDYGYGGSDSGAIGDGLYEKNVLFELGQMTKEEIGKRYNVQVLETRTGPNTFIAISF